MKQPPKFVARGESRKVYRLSKTIYGLKQSPRAWFGKFSEAVVQFGMKHCQYDHYVFSHTSERGKILLIVYVDDEIISDDDKKRITELKAFLQSSFLDSGIGKVTFLLGY